MTANGSEVFEVPLPALVTLSNEMGQARIPAGRGIILAAKKQFPKWGAADVGAETSKTGSAAARNSLVKLFIPAYQRTCELVTGKDPAEAAASAGGKNSCDQTLRGKDMAENKTILVIGEIEKGKTASITRELLGGARALADKTGGDVQLLLFGEAAATLASEGIALGADKVYAASHAAYNEFGSDAYTALVGDLCSKITPALCLLGQTDLGRDVAPRVAARLGAALAMDCIEVSL